MNGVTRVGASQLRWTCGSFCLARHTMRCVWVCDGCVPHCDARVPHLSALLSTLFGSVSINLFVKEQVGELCQCSKFLCCPV